MRTVSLNAALAEVLLSSVKTAEISTSPRTFFVHVRVPEHVADDLREVQKRVIPDESKREDIDHITLVYTRKPLEDHPPDKIHAALSALREIGEDTKPIDAKLQGWGFFDGASNGGKPSTALVALVDAPGLEHLHVDMVRALRAVGVPPSDLHVFTPHVTLGYLGHQGRPENDLPALSGKFTIERAHVASRDHHEIPLTGGMSLGMKAAAYSCKFALATPTPGVMHAMSTPVEPIPRQLVHPMQRIIDHVNLGPGNMTNAMAALRKGQPAPFDPDGSHAWLQNIMQRGT